MSIKNNNINLHIARCIATLLVVLNHALSTVYVDQINYSEWVYSSWFSKNFIVVMYSISRLGVPLFLMLTGVLILNKKFKNEEDIKNFYKKNLLSLVTVVTIWNVIYYFFWIYYNNQNFDLMDLIYTITFFKKSALGHMWYMPMIIGIYIFLPFVSLVVKKFDFRSLKIPIFITGLLCFFAITVNQILLVAGLEKYSLATVLNMDFSGACYGLYIILGYYIYNEKLYKKYSIKSMIYMIIACLLFASILQSFLYFNEAKTIVYYNNIFILMASISFFSIILNIKLKKPKFEKIYSHFSKNSLAIYFLHFPILMLLSLINISFLLKPFQVLLYYIASVALSMLIIKISKKVKLVQKYLFRA